MTGRGKSKQKQYPDTPDSSTTQSSVPSVDDEEAQLLPSGTGATSSSHQSRGRERNPNPMSSESSTPQSSVPSVVDEDAPLIQSSARTSSSKSPTRSTKDAQKAVAGTRSPYSSRHITPSRNAPGSTPEKSSLAIPDRGAVNIRSPSKSPPKSPSPFSQLKNSLRIKLSPQKGSPKRFTDSKSQCESTSSQKTDYPELKPEADAKRKSPKRSNESSSNVSEVILKKDVENAQSSNGSDSSAKVSSDDAPQSENLLKEHRLNVPEPERVSSSPKSPKKSLFDKVKKKLSPKSPERRKHEAHSKDASPKSSSKSSTSSSSASPISKKRQESDASNISSDNSRSSNTKSSSTSCANNNEYLLPDTRHQFLNCPSNNQNRNNCCEESSSDSEEHASNDRQQSMGEYLRLISRRFVRMHIASKYPSEQAQADDLEKKPVTERLDNIHFEEEEINLGERKPRKRSRSFFSNIIIGYRSRSRSKSDSKARQKDCSDDETQIGTTAACSDQPVGSKSPGIGSDEMEVDMEMQGATASWPDQSVKENTETQISDDAPRGAEANRPDQSVRKKVPAAQRGGNARRSDQSVRKKVLAAQRGDDARRSDQSVSPRDTETRRGDRAPHGVEERWVDKFLKFLDDETRKGEDASHGVAARFQAPRRSQLFQRAARPGPQATRHRSVSPDCEHLNIYQPGCSTIRKMRKRRKQRRCRQSQDIENINETATEVWIKRRVVQRNVSRLRQVPEGLSSLTKKVEKSSRLKAAGDNLLGLSRELNEIMRIFDSISVEAIRRNWLRQDDEIQDIVNSIDANRLNVPASISSSLQAGMQNLSSIDNEVREIRNKVRNLVLKAVQQNLSRIEEEMERIRENERLRRIKEMARIRENERFRRIGEMARIQENERLSRIAEMERIQENKRMSELERAHLYLLLLNIDVDEIFEG